MQNCCWRVYNAIFPVPYILGQGLETCCSSYETPIKTTGVYFDNDQMSYTVRGHTVHTVYDIQSGVWKIRAQRAQPPICKLKGVQSPPSVNNLEVKDLEQHNYPIISR